jgi:hypothetical protein
LQVLAEAMALGSPFRFDQRSPLVQQLLSQGGFIEFGID